MIIAGFIFTSRILRDTVRALTFHFYYACQHVYSWIPARPLSDGDSANPRYVDTAFHET
jgi:hypothetical protein